MSSNRRDSANTRPVGEEPPYLTVGTEVSAKYRGAFCEASIKSIKKMVKCKVAFDNGHGTSTVTDDCINGVMKVGSNIEVKNPNGQNMTGTLIKITDSSVYTVVFDDGDERTLKRTSLCIKGEKHFNESETLDHLPLTDPENFGTPVIQQGKKSRKGRKPSVSVDEDEMSVRKKLLRNDENAEKVVVVEVTEKKKTFSLPALRVSSVASQYGEMKSPDNILVRSFKDGKYIEVHPKDVKEFSKENTATSSLPKGESGPLKLALECAVKYIETKELPSDWNMDAKPSLPANSNSSSGEESEEDVKEKDRFMNRLTKFLEEKETPLLRSPVLGHRDLDLHKLFKIVSKMGGMDKITSWHSVYVKMGIPVMTTTAAYHIKNAYKRYLFEYEQHQREKAGKECQADEKKCGKNEKSSTKRTGTPATAKQKEEIPLKSDCDKESKELPLDNKLSNHSKPSRGKRGAKKVAEFTKTRADRTKALKSPKSPKLSPKSPCSPMSLNSVSASGSAGCPSPSGSLSESRESRTKAAGCGDIANGKKVSKETDVVSDGDVSKEENVKENKTKEDKTKEDKSKEEKSKEEKTKEEKTKELKTKELKTNEDKTNEDKTKEDKTKEDKTKKEKTNEEKNKEDKTRDDETKDENKSMEEVKRTLNDVKISLRDVLKKESKEKTCRRKEADSADEWKSEEELKAETSEDVEVKKENIENEDTKEEVEDGGVELEDAVDVVNSPSGTSDSVDGDEEEEKKSSDGRAEGNQAMAGNGDLEYKLSDRIDVRYGRGRNKTVYHAKITAVDPDAEENLYYLVHYAGWNSRHDEWIGTERIIGRGQKQMRTRNCKDSSLRNNKPAPKPIPKPMPKPIAKKNGKNGVAEKHMVKSFAAKDRKRTPSPTDNGASSRNDGRAGKNRSEQTSVDSLDLAEGKYQPPDVDQPDPEHVGEKSQDVKPEGGKDHITSPRSSPRSSPRASRRTSPVTSRTSPRSQVEKNSELASENDEERSESEGIEVGESSAEVKIEDIAKAMCSDNGSNNEDLNGKINLKTSLKRPHVDEEADSPPPKIKKEDDVAAEVVFDEKGDSDCPKEPANEPISPELESAIDEANTPDLTCSEQLSTNCVSPDLYTNEYRTGNDFFSNGLGEEENCSESKEKDSSSSVDEAMFERSPIRKANGRRARKTRAPSSQSSFEGSECLNGPTREPLVSHISSPTRTSKYNFTEDLDELLKKEESSERIRLLQEKIKDIRKIYGELKSEVANIDRKRKRRQKRKREEELSTEEGNARSPSRSSPLSATNGNAVSTSNSLATVECR